MADTTLHLDSVPANPSALCDRFDNLVVLPHTFPGASADIAAAADSVRTSFFAPNGADAWSDGARRLAETPSRNRADIAVKVVHGLFEVAPAPHGDRLAVDLSGLVCDSVGDLLLGAVRDLTNGDSVEENPALVAAFSTFRDTFTDMKAADLTADDASFYALMDPADDIMRDQPALTPAGVAMKLKRVFVSFVGEPWSDHALLDQRPTDFDANVRVSDLYQEMLWRSIEDLERMSLPSLPISPNENAAVEPNFTSIADAIAAARNAEQVISDYEDAHPKHTETTRIESNRLNDAAGVAQDEVGSFPVTTAAELLVKLGFMRERDTFQQTATEDWISADVARMAGGRAPWDHAFAKMEAARAAHNAIDLEHDQAAPAEQSALAEQVDAAGEDWHEAIWTLIAIPAPDATALRWKSEYLFGEFADRGAESPAWRTDVIASYMADVRRLLPVEG